MEAQTYTLMWHDGVSEIEILITLKPDYFKDVAHLEIRSIAPMCAPLPITETGYRSHFFHTANMDLSIFDPVAEVQSWIEKEASSPKWQKAVQANRQMPLF
jgi:hypothetical protein